MSALPTDETVDNSTENVPKNANNNSNDDTIIDEKKPDKSDTKSDETTDDSTTTDNNNTSSNPEIEVKESDFIKLSEIISTLEPLKATGNDHFKRKVYHLAITDYEAAIDYVEKTCKYSKMTKYLQSYKTDPNQTKSKSKLHHLRDNFEYTNENINTLNKMIGAIYNNRAFCYFRIELYGASVLDCSNAILYKFWKAYYRRGCSNAAMGKWGKAKKDFEKALKKFSKNKDIQLKLKQATQAWREQKFYKAIATEKGKPVHESVKLEDFGTVPDSYKGPKLPVDSKDITSKWVTDLLEWQKSGKLVHIRIVAEFILRCIKIFSQCQNVEYYNHSKPDDKDAHITVCGDVHGQYWDFLNIFQLNGMPSIDNPYLFNGDFVDRGSWSCEIIIAMMAWKIYNPDIFHMTRGNHETMAMNAMYGFEGECDHKYNKLIYKLFCEMFNYLPFGYILGKKVFVCHGGLFKQDGVLIDDLQSKINRNNQPNSNDVFSDCLWSDPQDTNGLAPSKRGGGTMFGPDITKKFLDDNGLELLIRSHEVQEEGYKVAHDGKCITIFSAPNYIDQMGNKGAFIRLDHEYKPHFTQFTAVPHPDIKPMAYARGPMGFGNFM